MKITHEQKRKIARKIIGNKNVDLFNNDAWNKQKEDIKKRVEKKQAIAHKRSLERKAKLKAENMKKHQLAFGSK